MIKIAFYGKGGIGKSTTVSNVSIALAQQGMKVLQVGCDPKADSTRLLRAGIKRAEDVGQVPGSDNAAADVGSMIQKIRSGASFTVMDHIRARVPFSAEDLVREGYAGVLCAEAGGPLPGQGCA